MEPAILDNKFAHIGARLKVADRPAGRFRTTGVISLDVQTDRKGEFFEIAQQPGADAVVEVLDVQPAEVLALLLAVADEEEQVAVGRGRDSHDRKASKEKLCGRFTFAAMR